MTVLGIDLGTTNSACGIWTEHGVSLIPNRLGELLTPSVVGIDEAGHISVGRIAHERLLTHPELTVGVFKRLMGSDHRIRPGNQDFSAAELSSLVLRSLKEDAEAHLGQAVTEAVISVPAYFNDNQRHATKLAGELAGLKVRRLVNEPTAAAMAYGLHRKQDGTFLILDMGGGTFDVTLLEYFDGVMEVHASAGDNFLGGEDFTEAMVSALLRELNVDRQSLDRRQLHALYLQTEAAKRALGHQPGAGITLHGTGEERQCELDQGWMATILTPLLLRARRPMETAIRDARISPQQIDDIVLVGGATRMPLFRDQVTRMFGRFPSGNLDPDLVVAMGAAVQAGLVEQSAGLDDVVLTDVCPYTLGTEVAAPDGLRGGYFEPIIERNTTVPVSISKQFVTVRDDQAVVEVAVYQGEHRKVEQNVFLGSLTVQVPRGAAHPQAVEVRFSYDMNGLLEVDVTVAATGETHSRIIENAPGSISEQDKARSRERLAALKFHPRDSEENRALLARGERLHEMALGDERQQIAQILARFDQVLEAQRPAEIRRAQQELKLLLDQIDQGGRL